MSCSAQPPEGGLGEAARRWLNIMGGLLSRCITASSRLQSEKHILTVTLIATQTWKIINSMLNDNTILLKEQNVFILFWHWKSVETLLSVALYKSLLGNDFPLKPLGNGLLFPPYKDYEAYFMGILVTHST